MTIAICLQVGDGVVLGADSATTLIQQSNIQNIYFNAEKIINLRKDLPIGALTFGLGGIRGRSIARLAKDLRQRLSDPVHPWYLDSNYTLQDVALRMREYFYEELYLPEYGGQSDPVLLGFFIAGFSARAERPEVWKLAMQGQCFGPEMVYGQGDVGLVWDGQREALTRLLQGYSEETMSRLIGAGLTQAQATGLLGSPANLSHPAMPIQDAIDVVRYLAETTCGFVRFRHAAQTVAPPIDLAAITYHESFRWVQRKHYFRPELNPELIGQA